MKIDLELDTLMRELRRPYPPESINFKIQTIGPKTAMVVAYIDARNVVERLDKVVPFKWSDSYRIVEHNGQLLGVECQLDVHGLVRADVGTVADDLPNKQMGGLKILYSDAFKRAGVKFGIGAFMYALPKNFVPQDHLNVVDWEKKKVYIPDKTEGMLRQKYQKWLEEHGIEAFGEPLSHGDTEGAQGDIEVRENE